MPIQRFIPWVLLGLGLFLNNMAYTQSYEELWRDLQEFEKDRQTRSAAEVAEKIYAKGKEEGDYIHWIRAMNYILQAKGITEEGSDTLGIKRLKQELNWAGFPAKNILHTYIAEYYWQYYQSQRWQIMNRTTLSVYAAAMDTWDTRKFHFEIGKHFQLALKEGEDLRNIDVGEVKELLTQAKGSSLYRPSLYDVLAHRALEYYQNTEGDLPEPKQSFRLNDKKAFAVLEDFVQAKISSPDTLSRKFFATKLYQDLGSHLFKRMDELGEKEGLYAVIDLDLSRLKYMRNNSFATNKDSLYAKCLVEIVSRYSDHPALASVLYEQASLLNQRSRSYNPFVGDTYRWDKKTALTICERVQKIYPETIGADRCKNLANDIQNKQLNLTTEAVQLPQKPFRIALSWQNVDKVWLRLVPYTPYLDKGNTQKQTVQRYLRQPILQTWEQKLPNTGGDFQNHSTELKIEKLPPGQYALLVSDNAEFALEGHAIVYADFQVSQLAYTETTLGNGEKTIYVMDRESGAPISNVSIEMEEWNWRKDKFVKLGKTKVSDKNGFARFDAKSEESYQVRFIFRKGKDTFISGEAYNYGGRPAPERRQQTYFFTDRKIYRPGQTIYFKGIQIERYQKEQKILPDTKVDVEFLDVNFQKVHELSFNTNEFGTFTGSFVAPSSGLLGQMHIRTKNGSAYFRVEEYKRPTFAVKIDPVEGSYSLRDKVTITGSAKAYSGSLISNATISYRVVREVRYPYWRWWYRPRPSSPAREIASGTGSTDANGVFSFDFEALPDESIDPKQKPLFTYRVNVDVVDITGETHSSSSQVQAGYSNWDIKLNMAENISTEAPGEAEIVSNNLNGQFVPAKGSLSIIALETPNHMFRPRFWNQVDMHLLDESTYKSLFPYDIYRIENRKEAWKELGEIWKDDFDTGSDKKIPLDALKGKSPGSYKIVLSLDGEDIEIVKYVDVFSPKAKKKAGTDLLGINFDKEKAEPGEKVFLNLGSIEKDVWVLFTLSQGEEKLTNRWEYIKKKTEEIEIPIEEKHRGNIHVSLLSIRHNSEVKENKTLIVPWTNKQLSLEWGTFRSKLQPGEKDQWTLTLTGNKAEKVAAEMVATLYDASLDQFAANNFDLSLYPSFGASSFWSSNGSMASNGGRLFQEGWNLGRTSVRPQGYDRLNLPRYLTYGYGGGRRLMARGAMPMMEMAAAPEEDMAMDEVAVVASRSARSKRANTNDTSVQNYSASEPELYEADTPIIPGAESEADLGQVSIRKNLQETAFFFPQLRSNDKGEFVLNFTIPEAITKWKFLGLAHSKDLQIGTISDETVTQKDLMVQPNLPRFLREGDKINLTAKVSNLSSDSLEGVAELRILDAFSNEDIVNEFALDQAQQNFSVKAGLNTVLTWDIETPKSLGAVIVQVVAKAGNFTDGEEHVLPILKNRMLVTESLPLSIRGEEEKEFSFEKLLSNTSETLEHQKLTLEFSSNPAWYAVQSLPYLMEYPYECTEQIFSRFYANALATHVANASPKTKQVFDRWKQAASQGDQSLMSNLEKNQELKNVLLEETPWLLNARDESERKKRMGLLFDLNRMADEFSRAQQQLQDRQKSNGAFSWFPGMRASRYITQLIATGYGHLQNLGVSATGNPEVVDMVQKAVPYLDKQIQKDYQYLKRYKVKLEDDNLGYAQIQYLYMRSFFKDIPQTAGTQEAYGYYYAQAKKYWNKRNAYGQGMISLILHRNEDQETAKKIIIALKENAVLSEEQGMYWKEITNGYFWYEAPIESQALLIEAFHEAGQDEESVEEMKIWLLKNKQTNDWETTRATVAACNALLQSGQDWLASSNLVSIQVGDETIDPHTRADAKIEAGTGYFKTAWLKNEIKPEMGRIGLEKKDKGIAWGAMYWQYFEELDKITYAETPLSVRKKLFIESYNDAGPILVPWEEADVKAGDKVVVRIELRVDRDMEYVHMKDMRAAGLEPINVLSQYTYKGGLGYYESTKDAATNFFFDFLPKGSYVFEYPLRVNLAGDFSNGITTLQCMYAPEFTSHTQGIRVKID